MNKNIALKVAGVVFAFVAVMHLLRLIFQWHVSINETMIPMWASIVGLIIAAILTGWMFLASREQI